MSDIVLSASVRQNLLSLQSTANLLATTQNRLATGLKVNSALDNPTNYFTAQSLDNRAGDINNLLDSIGNGVQVLQAANTGITSLQQLVDTAKSIANQALQATSGYSTKSNFASTAITGATASNLLGTVTAATNAKVTGTSALGTIDLSDTTVPATKATYTGSVDLSSGVDASGGDITLTINSKTVVLSATGGTGGTPGTGHYTLQDVEDAINNTAGINVVASDDSNGHLVLTSTTAGVATISASDDSGSNAVFDGTNDVEVDGLAATTTPASDLTFNVNGKTVTLAHGNSYTATQIKDAINTQVGSTANVNATLDTNGNLVLTSTGTASATDAVTVDNFSTGSDISTLGLGASGTTTITENGTDASGGISGQELDIAATAGGQALKITFGSGTESYDSSTGVATNVPTLIGLNTVLANNNLEASINSTGKLTITTTNDYASSTIGAISGTAVSGTGAVFTSAVAGPTADADAQKARASLVAQYNTVIDQIRTTAQDASFNGVNLLNGDQLKLVFNETGKSTLNIAGVTDDPAGLGLSSLTAGTDFLDNSGTNKILTALNDASSTLRSQASTLGSNLSIVQIRQDFNKNLINVLQTGSSNLTLADTNEEAANSQALSTRQSIAVSALSLANQSQQSVLQLLR